MNKFKEGDRVKVCLWAGHYKNGVITGETYNSIASYTYDENGERIGCCEHLYTVCLDGQTFSQGFNEESITLINESEKHNASLDENYLIRKEMNRLKDEINKCDKVCISGDRCVYVPINQVMDKIEYIMSTGFFAKEKSE